MRNFLTNGHAVVAVKVLSSVTAVAALSAVLAAPFKW
ncbi:MAG: hypothetical protein QOE03_1371 [Micromonosporaceae bacterium]|jgi:hypothetical protein|nr:hypothetical protein [Micromonosporaceae bacterium]